MNDENIIRHIRYELNGTHIMFVIEKQLLKSDLEWHRNTLVMPYDQLQTRDFLTPVEKEHIDDGCKIDVRLLGPSLQMYNEPMKLERWRINSKSYYLLRTNWNKFVQENRYALKQGATIQVWSFRKIYKDRDMLCLAIQVVERAESLSAKTNPKLCLAIQVVERAESLSAKTNPKKFKPLISKWQRFTFRFGSFARGIKNKLCLSIKAVKRVD